APEGSSPLAQVYAGHQFGGFSPQLGDGRALLIGEVIDRNGQRRDIQLKGSGRTPFSRQGDGKAVLGPVLREYLMGEAMHALGIPTSRALAAVTTGEQIMRDGPEPGAVLTRVAASHLRVGTFQFFAAQQDMGKVQRLADYAIRRHYRDLENRDGRYLAFLRAIIDRQASLIAGWMRVGFIHGVMNTDNMTISGETIDYGPCAFMDVYSPDAVFSSIDYQGRYAFGNQQRIGQWNLARLAETLLPLIHQDREESIRIATAEISAYPAIFEGFWLSGMRAKLGLATQEDGDMALAQSLLQAMHDGKADFTMTFRALADHLRGDGDALDRAFGDVSTIQSWLAQWQERLAREQREPQECAGAMDRVNPLYIARNHKVEEALAAAASGDYRPFETLLEILRDPFAPLKGFETYARPAPEDFGPYVTYCGT
ncbi:MAG: YdiU family protein, partial [Hyphomicrobiales bacterium]|nr:YdiU family protein [Hyphomicrobiales bacterium]